MRMLTSGSKGYNPLSDWSTDTGKHNLSQRHVVINFRSVPPYPQCEVLASGCVVVVESFLASAYIAVESELV